MLKAPKKNPNDKHDPYYCALQLQEILEKTNLSPILTMVMYEFLRDVAEDKIAKDSTIYEHIESLFADKIRYSIMGNNAEAAIHSKAKAYLVILLEIACHAKLGKGMDMELQALKDLGECRVNVRMIGKQFGVAKRGFDFIKRLDNLREEHLVGSDLIKSLTACTTDEVDYILSRYKKEDPFESGDVIVVDKVQA